MTFQDITSVLHVLGIGAIVLITVAVIFALVAIYNESKKLD